MSTQKARGRQRATLLESRVSNDGSRDSAFIRQGASASTRPSNAWMAIARVTVMKVCRLKQRRCRECLLNSGNNRPLPHSSTADDGISQTALTVSASKRDKSSSGSLRAPRPARLRTARLIGQPALAALAALPPTAHIGQRQDDDNSEKADTRGDSPNRVTRSPADSAPEQRNDDEVQS
jgi:hypothetical protein